MICFVNNDDVFVTFCSFCKLLVVNFCSNKAHLFKPGRIKREFTCSIMRNQA